MSGRSNPVLRNNSAASTLVLLLAVVVVICIFIALIIQSQKRHSKAAVQDCQNLVACPKRLEDSVVK